MLALPCGACFSRVVLLLLCHIVMRCRLGRGVCDMQFGVHRRMTWGCRPVWGSAMRANNLESLVGLCGKWRRQLSILQICGSIGPVFNMRVGGCPGRRNTALIDHRGRHEA